MNGNLRISLLYITEIFHLLRFYQDFQKHIQISHTIKTTSMSQSKQIHAIFGGFKPGIYSR